MGEKITRLLPGAGDTSSVHHYTMLVFNWNDEIIRTDILAAKDLDACRRMAEHIMTTVPTAGGYQLWQNGERAHATFPPESTDIAAFAEWRTRKA